MAKLTGSQYERLLEALLSAFPRPRDLRRMLRLKLGLNFDDVVQAGTGRDMVFELIETAEAEGWIADLVAAAREQNPMNADLAAIDFAVAAGVAVRNGVELEVLVSPELGFLDLSKWASQLPLIEARICAVELNERHRGTGFLVGPDVVLTNYHVVESSIKSRTRSGLSLRFDWSWMPETQTRNQGTVYELAEDWLVDQSPYSRADKHEDGSATPSESELDYALLRLAPEPKAMAPDRPENRGWISVPQTGFVFEPGGFLMIAQHPCGDNIRMAIDPRAILSVNEGATRVRYRTNTQPGSSGSPCFNSDLELVALHHAGMSKPQEWPPPNPCEGDPIEPLFNQGIPIRAIADRLRDTPKAEVLGA
jgi:hypothetical protein